MPYKECSVLFREPLLRINRENGDGTRKGRIGKRLIMRSISGIFGCGGQVRIGNTAWPVMKLVFAVKRFICRVRRCRG